MKIKVVIEGILEIQEPLDGDEWPDCKTIEDVVEIQQKFVDEGDYMLEEILDAAKNLKVCFYAVKEC